MGNLGVQFELCDEDLIHTGQSIYFDEDKLGTRWTYEFMGRRNQIDHILLSFSIKNFCRTISEDREFLKPRWLRAFTIDHGNEIASDHNLLVVELNLRSQ